MSTAEPSAQVLELLRAATVSLHVGNVPVGSGFFITDELILTAAHVVPADGAGVVAHDNKGIQYPAVVVWRAPAASEHNSSIYPMPDLAVLVVRSAATTGHAVALLGDEIPVAGELVAEGYSRSLSGDHFAPDTVRAPFEGTRPDPDGILLKCSGAALDGGMSGGPVLDPTSGTIIGVTKAQRAADLPTGLFAVAIATFRLRRPDLWALNQIFHRTDRRWRLAVRPGSTVRDLSQAAADLLERSEDAIARRGWSLPSEVDRHLLHQTVWIHRLTATGSQGGRQHAGRQNERIRWSSARQTHRATVVRALPGFGKSWLLAVHAEFVLRKGREHLERKRDPQLVQIPVVIECSALALRPGAPPDRHVVVDAIGHALNLRLLPADRADDCESMLLEAYDVGRLLICIDGLDEVPGPLRAQLRSVLTVVSTSSNALLIASRPSALPILDDVPLFGRLDVELAGFGARETRRYVEAWHRGNPATRAALLEALTRSSALRSIAEVPLLLSFLCRLAHADDQRFPTTEHALYEQVVDRLLSGNWRDTPTRAAWNHESPPDAAARKRVLARSLGALQDFWRGSSTDIMRSELSTQLRADPEYDYVHRGSLDRWEAWQYEIGSASARPPADPVIWELVFDGLLVDGGSGDGAPRVRVLHPALRDYLLSFHVASMDAARLAASLTTHRWFDPEWQEVYALATSGLSDPDGLIATILDTESDPWANQLIFALRCAVKCEKRLSERTLSSLIARVTSFDATSRRSDQRRVADAFSELVSTDLVAVRAAATAMISPASAGTCSTDLLHSAVCALAELRSREALEQARRLVGEQAAGRYRNRLVAALASSGSETDLERLLRLFRERGRLSDLSAFLSVVGPDSERLLAETVRFLRDRQLTLRARVLVANALIELGDTGVQAVVDAAVDLALEWSLRCRLFQMLIDAGIDGVRDAAMALLRNPNVHPLSKSTVLEAGLRAGWVEWVGNAMRALFDATTPTDRRRSLARAVRDIGDDGVSLLRTNLTSGRTMGIVLLLVEVLVEVQDRVAVESALRLIFDTGLDNGMRGTLTAFVLAADPSLIEARVVAELASDANTARTIRRDLLVGMARAGLTETRVVARRYFADLGVPQAWPDLAAALASAGAAGRNVLVELALDEVVNWEVRTEAVIHLARVEAPELSGLLEELDLPAFPEMWRNRIAFALTSAGSEAFLATVVEYVLVHDGAYEVLRNYMLGPAPAAGATILEHLETIDRARRPECIQQQPIQLNASSLAEVGYIPSSGADESAMLAFIYSELERRVGEALARVMTTPQLDEFEAYTSGNDEGSAFAFLSSEFPEYQSVVRQTFGELMRAIAAGEIDRPRPESQKSRPSAPRSLELAARVVGDLDDALQVKDWTRYFRVVRENRALLRTRYVRHIADAVMALGEDPAAAAHVWVINELENRNADAVAEVSASTELLRRRAVEEVDRGRFRDCWFCCQHGIVRHGAEATRLFYLGIAAAGSGEYDLARTILEDSGRHATDGQVRSGRETITEVGTRFAWPAEAIESLRVALRCPVDVTDGRESGASIDAGSATPYGAYMSVLSVDQSWTRTVGELQLTYLPDAEIEIVPTVFFPETSAADWERHPELTRNGSYVLAVAGALLAKRGDERLLIDAGLGPITIRPDDSPALFGALRGGDLPASCEAAGIDPTTVTTVALTHLHLDHLGWATQSCVADGRSLFPAASWAVGAGEIAGPHREDHLVLAGEDERTREIADGEALLPWVHAWALPGHTPGHTAWVLDAGDGSRVIAFGDAMHVAAQVEHPDWTVGPDVDGERARASRRALIAALAEPGTLGYGVHFADRQLGRVVDGRWEPVA